jgi:hypothetical protein
MDGGEENGGLLIDLTLTRELTPSSTLTFGAGRSFSDAGESLGGGAGGGGTAVTASPDPFQKTEGSLDWSFSRRRTTFGLGLAYDKREYETQTQFDNKALYYRAEFGRQLRPTLRLSLHATYTTEKYVLNDIESDDWTGGALLDWHFGRHLGLQLSVDRSGRSSSTGTGEYIENRVYLGFTFRGDRAIGGP